MAYNIATLSRFDFDEGFPTLREMQGMRPAPPVEQSNEEMIANLLSWQAVMQGRRGVAH